MIDLLLALTLATQLGDRLDEAAAHEIVDVAPVPLSDVDRPTPVIPSRGSADHPPTAPTTVADAPSDPVSSSAGSEVSGQPIYETDPEWDCRVHGNQRCGTGHIGDDGHSDWIDFSGPVPVVNWTVTGERPDSLGADEPADLTDDTDPVIEPLPEPTEIVETIETDTGHRDLDADGNVRNEAEADSDAALEAITNRTTTQVIGGLCVFVNEAGSVVSASTNLADCGIEPEPLPETVEPALVVNGETVEVTQ